MITHFQEIDLMKIQCDITMINNNNNPHWNPTVWAQRNNPWIITYIRPMTFTWETEAHKPETTSWCLDLIYNWTVFWLWIFCLVILHTKESNLHLHSNEGSLHCSTQFSIPQVQSFQLRMSSKPNVLPQWTAPANKSNTEAWWPFLFSPSPW